MKISEICASHSAVGLVLLVDTLSSGPRRFDITCASSVCGGG